MKKCFLGVLFLSSIVLHAASKEYKDLFFDYGKRAYEEILHRETTSNPQSASLLDYRAEHCVSPEEAARRSAYMRAQLKQKYEEVLKKIKTSTL
jgi:hypothetical protein